LKLVLDAFEHNEIKAAKICQPMLLLRAGGGPLSVIVLPQHA
jgi:hypothetical protein